MDGLVNWKEASENLKAAVGGPFAALVLQMGKWGEDY